MLYDTKSFEILKKKKKKIIIIIFFDRERPSYKTTTI